MFINVRDQTKCHFNLFKIFDHFCLYRHDVNSQFRILFPQIEQKTYKIDIFIVYWNILRVARQDAPLLRKAKIDSIAVERS